MDAGANAYMHKLRLVREKMRELKHAERYLMDKLWDAMDDEKTDRIETEQFTATRRQIGRTIMKKADVPPEVWERYAQPILYWTLSVRPL